MRLGPVRPAADRHRQADQLPERTRRTRGQHESMLLPRQPRGCKASVLCISLWMIQANILVSGCVSVDRRGCGKVDNRGKASLAGSSAIAAYLFTCDRLFTI
jgi:hypothetical protein